jgi:spermidine synthase
LSEVGFGTASNDFLGQGVAVSLLATYAGRAPDLLDWTKSAAINRDRNLRLQYLAGMYFNSYLSNKILQSILYYYRFPEDVFVGSSGRVWVLKQALAQQGRRER